MDEDLSKSRRNLIAVSVLLIVFDIAAISVGKISVLGSELVIGNAQVARVSIWVLWAYLLLRYVQFLGAEPDLGVRTKFIERMNHHMREKLVLLAKAIYPEWQGGISEVEYRHLNRKGISWTLTLVKYDVTHGKTVEAGVLAVPVRLLLSATLRSVVFVAFATPRGTEHFLPLLLALAVPIVAFWKS